MKSEVLLVRRFQNCPTHHMMFSRLPYALLLTASFSSASAPSRLRVVLLRHGESQNNVLNEVSHQHYRENRFSDPCLTDLGEKQAEATGAYFLEGSSPLLRGISKIYVSPFLRTLQTAKPVVEALKLPTEVWPEIFEVGGVFEGYGQTATGARGMTRGTIEEMFPAYDASKVPADGWYFGNTRETWAEAAVRVNKVADRLRDMASECQESGKDDAVCLVVHGDFIDLVVSSLLNMPSTGDQTKTVFRTYNTCITCVDIFSDGKVAVLFHNQKEHLGNLVKVEKLGVV